MSRNPPTGRHVESKFDSGTTTSVKRSFQSHFIDSHELFKGVMDNLLEGVCVMDADRRIMYWNDGATKITGYRKQQVLGCRCGSELLAHMNTAGVLMCERQCPLKTAINEGKPCEMEAMLVNSDGFPVPVHIEIMPIRDSEGRIVAAAQIFRDQTMFRETADRLTQMKKEAMEDPVTGLGNRRKVETVLNARIREFERYGMLMGIIFADINNFKSINDEYGHETGDRVLQGVAEAFRRTVRRIDTVGRWGGDEFVCVVPHTAHDELFAMAERLRMNVRRIQISPADRIHIRPSLSIGTASVQAGDTTEILIARADVAMYENKRRIKTTCPTRARQKT